MDRGQVRKITRHREFRACKECRRRKLRCDRQLPCASCKRRDEASSCFYESNPQEVSNSSERTSQAEARLEHLERLVRELSQIKDNPAQSADDNSSGQPLYNGPTHWTAMLEDIGELREVLENDSDTDDFALDLPSNMGCDFRVLFGGGQCLSFDQVLSQALPPRLEADRLVSAYFRAKAVAAPFIHSSQFRRLYNSFWNNPSAASPLWTSILMSVLDVATNALTTGPGLNAERAGNPNPFALAAAHCLAIGQYYKPQQFSVEALLLFVQCRCLSMLDISPEIGALLGTLIRLATMKKLHRDPTESKDRVSAFQIEMHRRTWSLCMQLDMLVSFQLGIPSNVQFPTWNTLPPTNLLDSDFDEDIEFLPPARPDDEATEILFYIAKHRLMAIFEQVLRHTLSTFTQPDDERQLGKLEKEIREIYTGLPAVFQPRPMTDSIVDPPSLIVTRLCVSFIYQKSLVVLHRKYILLQRPHSISVSCQAACDLVGQFLDIFKEFEPGGQLSTERWFMGSITWHDFLLACSTICLILCSTVQSNTALLGSVITDFSTSIELLQNARIVCQRQSTTSRDTRRVGAVIDAVLRKLNLKERNSSKELLVPSSEPFPGVSPGVRLSGASESGMPSEEDIAWPLNDSAWAYMEEFLNLPDDDALIEG